MFLRPLIAQNEHQEELKGIAALCFFKEISNGTAKNCAQPVKILKADGGGFIV